MAQLQSALITAAIAILTAVGGFIVAYFNRRAEQQKNAQELEKVKTRQDAQQLEIEDIKKQAAIQHYYINCPKCNEKIDLSKVEIYQEGDPENVH